MGWYLAVLSLRMRRNSCLKLPVSAGPHKPENDRDSRWLSPNNGRIFRWLKHVWSCFVEPLENAPYFYFQSIRHNDLESKLYYALRTLNIPQNMKFIRSSISELWRFYYRAALWVRAVLAVGRCLSVCPSVTLGTAWHTISLNFFLGLNSPIILVSRGHAVFFS